MQTLFIITVLSSRFRLNLPCYIIFYAVLFSDAHLFIVFDILALDQKTVEDKMLQLRNTQWKCQNKMIQYIKQPFYSDDDGVKMRSFRKNPKIKK